MRRFLKDESGQAIIEFMLLLLVTVGIMATLKTSLKNLTVKFWTFLAKRISAPCPGCRSDPEFDL